MSTLKVNNLQDLGADAVVTNGVVAKAALPSGSVLQVVQTVKTDTFTTSSTSFVDITGLSATITPLSTSSKVLVCVFAQGRHTGANVSATKLLRDSTDILLGDTAGSRTRSSKAEFTNTALHSVTHDLMYLDSPSTTSAVTYKIQVRVNANSVQFSATGDDSDASGNSRSTAQIILMEIAG
jgi:hypothetical protein